jgi:hypothetical protein
MSDEIRRLVDERWDEYGIDLGSVQQNGARRGRMRHLLRR